MSATKVYDHALLRGVLQSAKDGLTLMSLIREHREITGVDIPYRQLGYKTLESYLRAIPDVVMLVKSHTGEIRAFAKANRETQHIASLVARQKSNKSNRNRLNKSTRRPEQRPTNAYSNSYSHFAKSSSVPSSMSTYRHNSFQHDQRYSSQPSTSRSYLTRPQSHSSLANTNLAQSFTTKLSFENVAAPQQPHFDPKPKPPQPSLRLPIRMSSSNSQPLSSSKPQPLSSSKPQPLSLSKPQPLSSAPSTPPPISPSLIAHSPSPPLLTRGRGRGRFDPGSAYQRQKSWEDNLESKSYLQMLEDYVQRKELGFMVFKTFPMFSDHRRVIMATVTIQGRTYSSYPTESSSVGEAKELAAKNAIAQLANSDKEKKSKKKVSSDPSNILIRVREIIESHSSGIFHTHIPIEYAAKFNENLPDGWLELMVQNEMIKAEVADSTRTILYPFVDKITNGSHSKSDSSSSSGCSDAIRRRNSQIDLMPLDDSGFMDVYITYVMSPTDVALRLINYSDDYVEMANNMDIYYMERQNCVRVDRPREGHIYATKVDESWHRIKIISITQNDVLCNFVDHGDNESIDISNVFHLSSKFQELPHQAIHCKLSGLENYAENTDLLVILMELLLGKTLVAEINDRNNILLTLYDTSLEEDVNLNEKAVEMLTQVMLRNNFQVGNIFKGFMSHAVADGSIYVQIEGESLSALMDTLEVSNNFGEFPVKKLVTDKLYLVKNSEDEKWRRAVVVDDDGTTAKVFFVDTGKSASVSIANALRKIEIGNLLYRLPHQAFKCTMDLLPPGDNLEWTDDAVQRLWQIAGDKTLLMIKVLPPKIKDVPNVELLMRVAGESNLVVSINQNMALEKHLFKPKQVEIVPKIQLPSSNETPTITTLKEAKSGLPKTPSVPELPNVGQLLDIDVVMAASPSNFVCHSRSMGFKFDTLLSGMQEYYDNKKNQVVVAHDQLVSGNLCACYHSDDEMWYRANIKNVNDSKDMACIYLIDFGDMFMSSCHLLYHLPLQFQELPYQAFNCKLSGIQPVHADWCPEDCVRFQSLVEKKAFSALITDKRLDSDDIVGLDVQLFDVSTDKDINIGLLLVKENRAVTSND